MKFKIIITTFLLFLFPLALLAQTTGKIAGVITDKRTGEPIPGVNVYLEGTSLGASTDADGFYSILNVPAGDYTLKVSYVGYKDVTIKNVHVSVGLTTEMNIQLEETALELQEQIVVVAERPIIQKDLTASRTIMNSNEIKAIPIANVLNIVNITPGVVAGSFRGGRGGETLYQIDGVTVMDPMTRGFDTRVSKFAVEEISVITGGFSAEYGDAQSGVVNMVIKEGGPRYSGSVRYRTSDLSKVIAPMADHHALHHVEFSFGGPELISNYLFHTKDKLRFFVAGEFIKDNGRFPHAFRRNKNLQGKITWTPNAKNKIRFSFLGNWEKSSIWSNRWKRKTYEDNNPLLHPYDPSTDSVLASWKNNGRLDTEDINHNGVLDPGEDLNGNGRLDSEDLNHDGKLNVFNMLDHLPYFDQMSNNFVLDWTYQVGKKSFFEVKLSRYMTQMKYNVRENINEDTDGDGHLDLTQKDPATGQIIDVDGDGDFRHEDLNGNGIWDWKVDNGKTDLFKDENDNGYIDASEGLPRDQWLKWEQAPFGNAQDNDGFYMYGQGFTYYRLRWNFDRKYTYALKTTFYSQLDRHNEIKTGFEGKYYDMRDHDVDLASGGNVYGQNIKAYPNSMAAFFEDKMEYEGMILNMGLRWDYFDANALAPQFSDHPFYVNEKGQLGFYKPVKSKKRSYFSPRLGISHPITANDVIYFNYGRYFQMPRFSYLYTNTTFQLIGAFPIIGNPNIQPETTTSYELGLKHSFTRDMKIEVKGYYKDIQGLTDMATYYYNAANWAGFYYNTDYGNVRGFEVQFYKRMTRYWGATINYTYSIAKGKASSARQNYVLTWASSIIPTDENFLDWDQRHTVNAYLNLRIPEGQHLFGTSIFDDLGMNMIFQYGSGLPYSSLQRTRIPPINDKRRPPTYDIDMILDKNVKLSNKLALKFFLWGNNLQDFLFGHRNILGIADVNYYDGDQDGDGRPDRDPTGPYKDPSYYEEGTTWRIGVQLDF